jgi:hypothetical protein
MTLTTTFLQTLVQWTVSSLDARKCSANSVVTWDPSTLVEHVFRCGGEYTEEVKQKFAEMFPLSHVPRRNTVQQMADKFMENGSVADELRSDKPRELTEDKVLDISDRMMQSPKKSVLKLSQ